MRHIGMMFDGSTSLFETQRVLCNFIAHTNLLGHFTPYVSTICISSRHYFRRFVHKEYAVPLQVHNLPTLQVYWIILYGRRLLQVSLIHCQKHFPHLVAHPSKSRWIHNWFFQLSIQIPWSLWTLCRFFGLRHLLWGCIHLVLVEATVDCGPRVCLNFVDFIWDNIKTFAFIKYAIVYVPL
jgi:hypothetical protein